jgi:hypothetical protein
MNVAINPGTGPINLPYRRTWAVRNIDLLRQDLRLPKVEISSGISCRDGRWSFRLKHGSRSCVVHMPGCGEKHVRFFGNLPDMWTPRLYVDGDSWLWPFAVDTVREILTGANE